MGTAGDAPEQNWPIIQAHLEDLSSYAQLSTTLRTRGDYTHCITNSALDGGGRLVSRPRRFTPGEREPSPPQHPLIGGFGGSPKQVWA